MLTTTLPKHKIPVLIIGGIVTAIAIVSKIIDKKKCKITTKKPSSFNQTMNSFKLFAKSLFAPVE